MALSQSENLQLQRHFKNKINIFDVDQSEFQNGPHYVVNWSKYGWQSSSL